MPADALLARQANTEAAQGEVRRRVQKIAQILDQEWQVDGVDPPRDEGGVVEKGRKRVRDWVANNAKYPRLAVQCVRAIKMLQFRERNLPWSGCGGHRGIGEGAAFPQREAARRQA